MLHKNTAYVTSWNRKSEIIWVTLSAEGTCNGKAWNWNWNSDPTYNLLGTETSHTDSNPSAHMVFPFWVETEKLS